MATLRTLIASNRALAAALLALALLMKVLVPAGFMPVAANDTLTIQICPGVAPAPAATAHHAMPAKHHHTPASKADLPCAFAGLTAPSIAATDPALLVAAIAFVLALAIRAAIPAPRIAAPRLRPPLRAPPLPA